MIQIGLIFGNADAKTLSYSVFIFLEKVGRVDFDTQIQWFNNTIQQLNEMLGPIEASMLVKKSIIISVMGSNDYVNNYLLSYAPDSKTYTPTQFKEHLLKKIPGQIEVSIIYIHIFKQPFMTTKK